MARAKTELENFLVYGVDEKNRKVYFGSNTLYAEEESGTVTQTSCDSAIRAIERMATDHPKTPIELHMNSYGGDPYAMLALYDIIQSTSCQIKFFGKGAVMSAATWIMVGCDERNLYPHSTVMVHNGNDGYLGNVTDFNIYKEEGDRLMNVLYEIYEENTRMDKKFWQEICKRDLFLSAEEAVTLGLADKIIRPRKRGNLRKSREYHLSQDIDKKRINKLTNKLMKRIHADTKIEVNVKEYKPEPIDERLTIEPIKKDEEENNNV